MQVICVPMTRSYHHPKLGGPLVNFHQISIEISLVESAEAIGRKD